MGKPRTSRSVGASLPAALLERRLTVLLLVAGVLSMFFSSTALAGVYPKGKTTAYVYRSSICGGPGMETGLCAWVRTVEEAGANNAARYGTIASSYSYPCGQPTYCVQTCYSYLVLNDYSPFSEGGWLTNWRFRSEGTKPIGPSGSESCQRDTSLVTQTLYRSSGTVCPVPYIENPKNTQQCICPEGTEYVDAIDSCKDVVVRSNQDDSAKCSPAYGRPIFPATASKRTVVPVAAIGPLQWGLAYDSRRWVPSNGFGTALPFGGAASFGALWESGLHRSLRIDMAQSPPSIQAWRGSARMVTFTQDGTRFRPNASVSDRLVASGGNWLYYDIGAGALEVYNSAGKLMSVWSSAGQSVGFTYSDTTTPTDAALEPGLLIEVRDDSNRVVRLRYDGPVGWGLRSRVRSIVDVDQRETKFNYDTSGRLTGIGWPDATSRTFLYEDSTFSWALTGVLDELKTRINTIHYDGEGRASETLAVGEIDHYKASWTVPPSLLTTDVYDGKLGLVLRSTQWVAGQGTSVQLPNQTSTSLQLAVVDGMSRVTAVSQPAGAGCAASSSSLGYDGNGNVVQSDDFNGNRSCMAYDLGRNLQTARIEGLPLTADCKSLLTATALPVGSRKSATQWHPDWALATRVAEPGRITTTVYNGQPDPFNGNAPANCAPATAVLPDGKPIVVVCKKVEQATAGTDTTGVLGLDAPLDGTVPARTWAYTYNGNGQMLSANGPRAAGDANDSTTYEYWSDTVFTGTDPDAQGHTLGDLKRVTNALGQAVQYTKYNKTGQLLESIDANQVLTVNTYDARQRLLSSQVGSELTRYEYHPTGLLKKVTQPDNVSFVKYTYDDAHRLTLVEDHLGNSVKYELDNLGNRVSETVKDPGGAMRRTLGRSIDALGRVQQLTGRQ